MKFSIDPRLTGECVPLKELAISTALLRDDRRFPWVILVPRRMGAVELLDLSARERGVLMDEIARVSEALRGLPGTEKLNVAALGNMVPQLHVHIIARHAGDAAWPGPVWGVGEREPYEPARLAERVETLRDALLTR